MPPAARAAWRFLRDDRLFIGFFAIYTALAFFLLALGLLATLARSSGPPHDLVASLAPGSGSIGRLARIALTAPGYPEGAGEVVLDYALSAVDLALGVFLFWLRPRDWTARLLALALIGFGAAYNLPAHGLLISDSGDYVLASIHLRFHAISGIVFLHALLRFPDGRIRPRWARWPLLAGYVIASPDIIIGFGPAQLIAAVIGGFLFLPGGASAAFSVSNVGRVETQWLVLFLGVMAPAAGILSQAARFRDPRTVSERQQAKLLLYALVISLALGLLALVVYALTVGLEAAGAHGEAVSFAETLDHLSLRLFPTLFTIIPLALFVGLIRFRLWEIDRVINRTFVYGALAAFITAVYVGMVVGVGSLIGSGSRPNLLLSVLATAIVGVAFQPVRERLQRYANRLVYGARATPYEVLSDFSERIAQAYSTEELPARMARLVAEATGAERAEVWLRVGGELRPAASWPTGGALPQPVSLVESAVPLLPGRDRVLEVRHQGELLGALSVTQRRDSGLTPVEEQLLADLAHQAGLVLRNLSLTAALMERVEELRASRVRLVTAQDTARRRLERNLHDGAQQHLVALKVKIGLAKSLARGDPARLEALLAELGSDADEALETLRDLARGIYPPLLADKGLPTALQAQLRKTGMQVELTADGVGRYRQEVEGAVYFCCLEALQNVSKYARAERVSLRLDDSGGTLTFAVEDDGAGFDADHVQRGAGLQNMIDRVEALGGTVAVASTPGQGTMVSGRVPLATRAG